MNERDSLDRLITGVLRSGTAHQEPDACPDEMEIAVYVDGALDAPETERVERHLEECFKCAREVESALAGLEMPMSKPYPRALESAAEKVRAHNEGVFGIAVRLVKDAIRMVGDIAGSGPEPVLAPIRGRKGSTTLVSTSKTVRDLQVDIDVENVGGGMVEVIIGAKNAADGKPAQGLRANLFMNGRETDSISMAGGRAAFEGVSPGRYTINLTSNGFCLADIELDIQKES